MSTKKAPAAEPVDAPAEAVRDAHHGQGGSYVLDPDTGVRTLVARTDSREVAAQAGQAGIDDQGGV